MIWIVSVLVIMLLLFWLFGGLRETVGDLIIGLFPRVPMKQGDKVNICLNGEFNRVATITQVSPCRLYIYDGNLGLPIDYRGRFYAVGVDPNDGSRLVYVKYRKHFRFVRMAEIVRNAFSVIDDEEMLPVSDVEHTDDSETGEETEEEEK